MTIRGQGLVRFESSDIHQVPYLRFKLFNYREYSELMALGLEPLSFMEYVVKLINEGIDEAQTSLYNVFPEKKRLRT